jgi:thiol-disulfide isomerase/thioredoxin
MSNRSLITTSSGCATVAQSRYCIAVLAACIFALACNSAAPPRPITESDSAPVSTTRSNANERAIQDALDVPIARLDGSSFKLADYRGQVLVVDFWATYCPPCVKQAPQLAKLNERYRSRGLTVVGLTADKKEDQPLVEEFIKKAGINYQIGYDNSWLSTAFLKGTEDATGSPPIPQLFVLARDGRVVEHLIGERPGGLEQLEKVINEQLGQ